MKHTFRNLIRREKWALVEIEPLKDADWYSTGVELLLSLLFTSR